MIELDYALRLACVNGVRKRGTIFVAASIARGYDRYRIDLQLMLELRDYFRRIPAGEPTNETQPWWENPWFPPLDVLGSTALLVKLNPRHYIEVGSAIRPNLFAALSQTMAYAQR